MNTSAVPGFAQLQAPATWRTVDFISDLHLQASEPATFDAWRRYMQATPADAVFILGDLFEVWVGDDVLAQAGFEADCAAVMHATAQRTPVFFMHGNRDFLAGDGLMAAAGTTLLHDPTVLAFNDQRFVLTHGDAQGDVELRQALADYLEEYRGVRCTAEQVVVGAGMEYLLSLLAPLLPGKTAVENPGYQRAKQVLENNGVACCCLPVDADGLSVEALSGSGAAVCYVTPSHQFPTGVTMPAGRRTELLHWASRCPGQRYIIEDDYDSEFRFDTRPLPSLQGMAGADGPVVYLSTCSRSLAPGIRIAYMVLPRQLLPAWRAKYRIYSGTVSRFEQQTLARFIREGYFTRHLARERVAYKARRDALAASLRAAFAPDELTLTGLHTGLHLLARLKNAPPDAALHAAAKAQGVALSLLSDYDLTGGEQDFSGTFVLGYGSLSEASFPEAGETLRKVCTAAREASVTV